MSNIRFIPAPISIQFSKATSNYELFKREFDSFNESDSDPVGQWLKMAKARGETKESDQVMLTLLVELHRKVDQIASRLENNKKAFVPLDFNEQIDGINFDYFKIKNSIFDVGVEYYGRVSMPTFPKRDVAIFFAPIDQQTAKITIIHERDRKEWDSYVTSRERAMIREMKNKKE